MRKPPQLLIFLLAALWSPGAAFAQCGEESELSAVGPALEYGHGAWVSQDHLIVLSSNAGGQRVFYLFDRDSHLQVAAIPAAPDGYVATDDGMVGKSVDAHGQTLMIGVPGADQSPGINDVGVVEVYDLATFAQVATITAPAPQAFLGFGSAVSISDSVIAISAPGDWISGPQNGEVFLFGNPPGATTLHTLQGGRLFGSIVRTSDQFIAVASTQHVSVFSATTPFAEIVTIDVSGSAFLAVEQMELLGDRLYASVEGSDLVSVFDIHSGVEVDVLAPSLSVNSGGVRSLSVDGDSLATGQLAVGYEGSIYLYSTADHSELGRYVASGAVAEGPFAPGGPHDHGRWVAIDGDDLLAGASGEAVLFDLAAPCELTTFCYGDGESGSPCLCGNESAPGAREGCRNSTGVGATLRAVGSTAIADDDLTLVAAQGPPGMPGVFVQRETTQALPFFDGVLCMGNPTRRLEFAHFDGQGHLASAGSIAAQGVVAPGATRHYQLWYRDPGAGGPCGTGANLTNGVRIDWL